MNLIVIGAVFTALNFTINVTIGAGSYAVDVLPNFIGYFLIFLGCARMKKEVESFRPARILSLLLMFFFIGRAVVLFLAPEFAGQSLIRFFINIVHFYLLLLLVRAVMELERRRNLYLYSDKLRKSWIASAACTATAALGGVAIVVVTALGLSKVCSLPMLDLLRLSEGSKKLAELAESWASAPLTEAQNAIIARFALVDGVLAIVVAALAIAAAVFEIVFLYRLHLASKALREQE